MSKIVNALDEAAAVARQAARVAFLIQEAREEGISATRTAYRILGALGLTNYSERPLSDGALGRQDVAEGPDSEPASGGMNPLPTLPLISEGGK